MAVLLDRMNASARYDSMRPTLHNRAQGVTAYLSILATSLAAFAGAPMWAIVPGTLVLLTISLVEQRKLSPRFAAIGASYMLTIAAWQSAGEALIATGAAFGLGALSRALLGA